MRLRPTLVLVLILLGLSAGLSAGVRELMQPAQDLLRRAAVDPTPGSLALMILVLGIMPFSIVFPMTAASVLAGALLPSPIAPFVILAGMLLNTLLSWTIARTLFGRRLEAWIEARGGALGNLRAAAKRAPFKWSFFSRFIPSPFALTPMVLASAGVSLGQVLGATAVVMTPWSFVYTWAGHESREGSLASLGLAGLGIAAISLLTLWLRQRYVMPAEEKDSQQAPAAKRPVAKKGGVRKRTRTGKAKA